MASHNHPVSREAGREKRGYCCVDPEEYGETNPFPFFCSFSDDQLIEAVREGRKREFADFTWQAGDLTFTGIALGSIAALLVYHSMRLLSREPSRTTTPA